MTQEKRLLSVKDACHYLGISRMTLLDAEERGLIAPERTAGGHRRYTLDALRGLLQNTRNRREQRTPVAAPEGMFQLSQYIADLQNRARTPEHALKEALRNLVLLLQVEMGVLYLRDGTGTLRLQAAYGIPHWFLGAMDSMQDTGVSGEVLRHRRPQVYDRRTCSDLPPPLEIGQGLCVPLIYHDDVLGCVHIMARNQHQFFPSEITIATTVAVYIASLVVNTQLLDQVQTRLRELSLLSQLSQALETTAELDPLLDIFIDGALNLVGEQIGTIYLSDESGQYLFLKTARGTLDWLYPIPLRTDTGIIGWMFQHMRPYYSPSLANDPLLPPEFVEGVRALPTVSCLCLPMRTGNQIVGVFSINTQHERTFTPDEIRVLMTASSEAAIAIHRAQLLAIAKRTVEEQRQLNVMHISLLDELSLGVIGISEGGAISVWNQVIERISGIPATQIIGHVPRPIAPTLTSLWDSVERTLADHQPRSTVVVLPDGTHLWSDIRSVASVCGATRVIVEVQSSAGKP